MALWKQGDLRHIYASHKPTVVFDDVWPTNHNSLHFGIGKPDFAPHWMRCFTNEWRSVEDHHWPLVHPSANGDSTVTGVTICDVSTLDQPLVDAFPRHDVTGNGTAASTLQSTTTVHSVLQHRVRELGTSVVGVSEELKSVELKL